MLKRSASDLGDASFLHETNNQHSNFKVPSLDYSLLSKRIYIDTHMCASKDDRSKHIGADGHAQTRSDAAGRKTNTQEFGVLVSICGGAVLLLLLIPSLTNSSQAGRGGCVSGGLIVVT